MAEASLVNHVDGTPLPSGLVPLGLDTLSPIENSEMFGTSILDADFWDPNILSTTNWLDAIDDTSIADWQTDIPVPDSLVLAQKDDQQTTYSPVQKILRAAGASEASRPLSFVERSARVSTISMRSSQNGTSATSFATEKEDETEPGSHYVDGSPARLPRATKKRKRISAHLDDTQALPATTKTQSFRIRFDSIPVDNGLNVIEVPDNTYESITHSWHSTCKNPAMPWKLFEQIEFPQKTVFEHLLWLYFDCFDDTLPLIHRATFVADELNWPLVLAMCAIGAHYLDDVSDTQSLRSMHEFVRRVQMLSDDINSTTELARAQTSLLHAVGAAFCGNKNSPESDLQVQMRFRRCFSVALTQREGTLAGVQSNEGSTGAQWQSWCAIENCIRTAYSAWLLDCMWAYQFQLPPTLSLADACLPMPCHEKLWDAKSADEWKYLLCPENSTSQTLQDLLQAVYIDKRLPKACGEFSRILLIHGIFQRSWDVERYFSSPLTHWQPTAKKQSSQEVLPQIPVCLYSVPEVVKWQNSACDCLDILHWQANAAIGLQSGIEHPTVLHLHMARVVLLTPLKHILRLAKLMTTNETHSNVRDIQTERNSIQRWAVQNQYKARLAAIHAGVIFWHVRRYSIDGFYEVPAVALATMMLWAFGSFSSNKTPMSMRIPEEKGSGLQRPLANNLPEVRENGSEDCMGDIVLLDRPTDDELVQEFIRRGHTMRTHMTGVGDIYGRHGPGRVLNEGCKHLTGLKCWGLAETWIELFQKLRTCSSQEQTLGDTT